MAMIFELCERARLMSELQRDEVQIALPVDVEDAFLLASPNGGAGSGAEHWVSIRVDLVAANAAAIGQSIRAARPSGLVVMRTFSSPGMKLLRTFAFTPSELILVKMLAIIGAAPTRQIQTAIEPFGVRQGEWRQKLEAALIECEDPVCRAGLNRSLGC
jgi:hypothetical protein